MYVFDTAPLSTLFKNFYRKRFPSLWNKFDNLVSSGAISCVKETLREIDDGPVEPLRDWAARNGTIFFPASAREAAFISRIYSVPHFQQNIEQRKLLKGGRNADPFIIAKASIERKCVVTMEQFKLNSAKIPNICQHFGIDCILLEEFMEREGWIF
jgi:hypothetical protein